MVVDLPCDSEASRAASVVRPSAATRSGITSRRRLAQYGRWERVVAQVRGVGGMHMLLKLLPLCPPPLLPLPVCTIADWLRDDSMMQALPNMVVDLPKTTR